MSSKFIYFAISVLIFILISTSCENKVGEISDDLIEKAFLQKLETFKENKREECLNGIMVDAEELVDSIIAEQLSLDTIDFPRKPTKPNSPSLKEIPEEFDLEPIKK